MKVQLRKGNIGDYLMFGELVRGGYNLPDISPLQVIDCGANIGMFAIQAACYFPEASLTCYEPDSENFELLLRNLEINRIKADLRQKGVWSTSTTLYFHPSSNKGTFGYVDEPPPGIEMPCELPDINDNNCWLKIDVEGAEYEVVSAIMGKRVFPAHISMEIHYYDKKGKELVNLLRDVAIR